MHVPCNRSRWYLNTAARAATVVVQPRAAVGLDHPKVRILVLYCVRVSLWTPRQRRQSSHDPGNNLNTRTALHIFLIPCARRPHIVNNNERRRK
jgi:hypothetical protein